MSDLHADESEHVLVNCMWKSQEHCNTPDHGNNYEALGVCQPWFHWVQNYLQKTNNTLPESAQVSVVCIIPQVDEFLI